MSDFGLIHDVPEETLKMMVVFGHAALAADGVYELTEKGEAWLRSWCEQKLAEGESA